MGQAKYVLVGDSPALGGSTTISVTLVPVTLAFEAKKTGGKAFVMDAAADIPRVLDSPVFSNFRFPRGGTTQYVDAMLRTTFPAADSWHTKLSKSDVKAVRITVPVGYGYVLTSKASGRSFAIVDIEFLQRELFKQLPKQEGKLVLAITHNAAYYSLGDATVCCSWGRHGVDSATGTSFILASYLHSAPPVVEDDDVQPLTQQLAEFIKDPLHDPLVHGGRNAKVPGNAFPAWMRPASQRPGDQGSCGGTSVASTYFLLEPTNTNPKNNIPASKSFLATVEALDITCRTLLCCLGTQVPLRVSVTCSASLTHRPFRLQRRHARREVDDQATALHRRSRKSRPCPEAERPTDTN